MHQVAARPPRSRGSRGAYTIVELLLVLGIIALLASMTFATFSFVGSGRGLKGVVMNLRAHFELARSKAIQKRTKSTILFKFFGIDGRTVYDVFYETGAGGSNTFYLAENVEIPTPIQRVDSAGVTQQIQFRIDFNPDGTISLPTAADVDLSTFDDAIVDNEVGELYFTDTPGATSGMQLLVINMIPPTGRFIHIIR